MRRHMGISLILIALLFLLPWLWAPEVEQRPAEEPPREEHPRTEGEEAPVTPEPSHSPVGDRDSALLLRVLIGGQVRQMDMGEYLTGVVRAEMPASFSPEALKAQAVAARTYTLYKMENGGSAEHPQADACDDISCCKAYMDEAVAAAGWGDQAGAYEERIRAAVRETDGECILYGGRPVLAVFHSSSAGRTQDAADVWSQSLPYLQSVTSPEDESTVPQYRSSVSFDAAALQAALQQALPEAALEGRPSDWFTNLRQTAGGAVSSLSVGGVEISGNRLRTILGLRSPCFTMAFQGEQVVFSVTGYGHGVGMSQYGANVLAADGMDYREILAWYYTDTQVGQYSPGA